jgi:hypothetical protein
MYVRMCVCIYTSTHAVEVGSEGAPVVEDLLGLSEEGVGVILPTQWPT